jgi:hypothetical protein
MRNNSGLSGARAGEDQERTFGAEHSLALLFV